MSNSESENDEFAKNIIERAKLRVHLLPSNFQKTAQTVTEKSMKPKKMQQKSSLKLQSLETEEETVSEENKVPIMSEEDVEAQLDGCGDKEPLPVGQRKPLKRLGELYSGAMIWSPAHSHTEGERTPDWTPLVNDKKTTGRQSRLNALAKKINEWEDDLAHYVPPASRFNISPPKQSRKSTCSTPVSVRDVTVPLSPDRNNILLEPDVDVTPQIKLNTPLSVRDIEKKASSPQRNNIPPNVDLTPRGKLNVAQKTALFESRRTSCAVAEKDPAELSVAQRMKIFEQQASIGQHRTFKPPLSLHQLPIGQIGKRIFAEAPVPSKKHEMSFVLPRGKVESQRRMFEKGEIIEEEPTKPITFLSTLPQSMVLSPPVFVPPPPPPPLPMDQDFSLTFSALADSEDKDRSRSRSQSPQKGMILEPKNTTPKRRASPSPHRSRSASPNKKKYSDARNMKRIRVNDPKPGRMYPSLTDIESTETETEAEGPETTEEEDTICSGVSQCSSLGLQIERIAKGMSVPELRAQSPVSNPVVAVTPRRNHHYRPTEDFSASLACRQIDAMIDDALEGQDFSIDTIIEDASPLEASSPLYAKRRHPSPALGTPLLHTVSFFRKQQEQLQVTPRKTVARVEMPQGLSIDRRTARVDAVNDVVKKLEEELAAQHRSIAQVSKALSLCKSTVEFSESTENVECERILLIATQKRTGILNEIHRLKTDGVLSKLSSVSPSKYELGPSCRGKLTISKIAVQLKKDFLNKIGNGNSVYNFITLMKHRHQVDPSSLFTVGQGLSSTNIQNGILHFPNTFILGDLEPDFEVKLEVYVLQTQKEFLPHETKYHIKKESKGVTPKKLKSDSKFSRAVQHSPAGPDAVRTTNFGICGSVAIDITTLGRSHWNLDGVRSMSPVEGSLTLKIHCNAEGGVEERGFLTLFHDVSGLGAWHRRWCKLTATHISFWMYPEDEAEDKVPIDQIALRHCVTTRVCPVARDVSARANTILLVTTRQPLSTDKVSLITSCHGDYTAIRHLMSADTREERDLWCGQMNRALANLRAWDPQAHSPDDTLF